MITVTLSSRRPVALALATPSMLSSSGMMVFSVMRVIWEESILLPPTAAIMTGSMSGFSFMMMGLLMESSQ